MNRITFSLFVAAALACCPPAVAQMISDLAPATESVPSYQTAKPVPPAPTPNQPAVQSATPATFTSPSQPKATASSAAVPGQYLGPSQSLNPTDSNPATALSLSTTGPRWTVSTDALWLSRDLGRGIFLGDTEYNYHSDPHITPPVRTSNLWSDDVLPSLAPGLRLQLTAYVSDDVAFELGAWGLQNWSVERTIYGDPANATVLGYSPYLQTSSQIGGYDNTLGYTYRSEVANAEINQRFKIFSDGGTRSSSWLWGVRYFHLSDDFTLGASDLYTNTSETLNWQTKNNLVGMQAGLHCAWEWNRLQLSTEIKGGLYANIYNQNGTDTATGTQNFQAFDVSHNGTDLSALFEFSLLLRYQVTDNLSLRGGYQYYGVTGLALGPRQLVRYDTNGSINLDGLSIGVEFIR